MKKLITKKLILLFLLVCAHAYPQNIDNAMKQFMDKWKVPGGQIAIAKNGKIEFINSYGYADRDEKSNVTGKNLFRIASVSKAITAVGIFKLIEEGKLSLQDKAMDILKRKYSLNCAYDKRLDFITIDQLLEHTGGWSLDKGDRQIIHTREAAIKNGGTYPPTPAEVLLYGLCDSLDFNPGEKYSYSNFGYNFLGRIIEITSGIDYETFCKEKLFKPSGAEYFYTGKTRENEAGADEVKYYDYENADKVWSVLPVEKEQVYMPYGGDFAMECLDAHGGWVTNAESLLKFFLRMDPKNGGVQLLKKESVDSMTVKPPYDFYKGSDNYTSRGFVIQAGNEDIWLHAGALYGTSSFWYRNGKTGVTLTVVFNFLPMKELGDYFGDMKNMIHEMTTSF